ncbi:hypothetical protein BDZ90DRAFT_272202 [Jaminaea rosea]|uniref:LTV-domain-containing protein n=1 Tax=Jaminaea rosea TaxID=1569628 RepID=A0A316UPD5_9BASI|nr:hypothetical protein BDZ90DRAFT_272202 [Jaminaea rosea]PWN27162.1 hypothetical protein BDZ90DRAFT_272202 [Jaminaea rosea]
MPPKSKWRSSEAQHFTLVHRSQRDPLINDPEASSRVLAPSRKTRNARGQPISKADLDDEFGKKERSNVGEAAEYGVYFDDTEYDYMQHLRPIGGNYNAQRGGKDEEDDVDVVMLPGPQGQAKGKGKAKTGGELEFKDEKAGIDLPQDVLASEKEMPRDWTQGEGEEHKGLRLDMDPHLRQALEALDDEAFLAGRRRRQQQAQQAKEAAEASAEDDDDFDALFAEVVAGGEYDPDHMDSDEEAWRAQAPGGDEALYLTPGERARQKLQATTAADGEAATSAGAGRIDLDDPNLSLSERVALFKEGLGAPAPKGAQEDEDDEDAARPSASKAGSRSRRVPSSIGGSSIFGDGNPGRKSKPGSKARHAMSFYAPSAAGGSTAWSMSSSAMARNAGLTNLDDGFDRMEQIYEQDGEEDDDEMYDFDDEDEDGDGPDPNALVREDFGQILDEFLEKHEVIAGRMRQRLGDRDASGAEKLDILRKEVGAARIERYLAGDEETQEEIDRDIESRIRVVGLRKDEWDVETIQTTKTNVSNHPRVLSSVASSARSGYQPGTLASNGSVGSLASAGGSSAHFESIPKVKVNPRTGVAEVVGWTKQRRPPPKDADVNGAEDDLPSLDSLSIDGRGAHVNGVEDDDDGSGPPPAGPAEDDSGSDTSTELDPRHVTIKRDRNESAEEKRRRKTEAKEAKQSRKLEKSARKKEFENEKKRQTKIEAGRRAAGATAMELRVGGGAGRRLQ